MCADVQGYSGGDSSGSEDEDMDSEDEEVDMGEVRISSSLSVSRRSSRHCSAGQLEQPSGMEFFCALGVRGKLCLKAQP